MQLKDAKLMANETAPILTLHTALSYDTINKWLLQKQTRHEPHGISILFSIWKKCMYYTVVHHWKNVIGGGNRDDHVNRVLGKSERGEPAFSYAYHVVVMCVGFDCT